MTAFKAVDTHLKEMEFCNIQVLGWFYWGKVALGQFPSSISVLPFHVLFHGCSIYLFICHWHYIMRVIIV